MEFAMNGISPMYFYLCQCFLPLRGMTSHGDLGKPFQTAQVERGQISAFTTMESICGSLSFDLAFRLTYHSRGEPLPTETEIVGRSANS